MNYRISILTIGDEICIGQITNTNASWIANECAKLGADVVIHSTIGDGKEVILNELSRLQKQSNCVLITGGLGPTHDDVTKECLCTYFNDTLVENQDVLNHLQDLFAKRGRELSPRNAMQAMLPTQCTPLQNNLGTAPGMKFVQNGVLIISMPGVPTEMKGLMNHHVLPLIKQEMHDGKFDVVQHKTLMTTGIPESYLADAIGNTEVFLHNSTLAFLPSYSGVRLRITSSGSSFVETENEIARISSYIYNKAGEYIYAEDDKSLAEVVQEKMLLQGKTLSIAESCTGGLLGSIITDVPGSSGYFMGGVECYSNESKIRDVGVREVTITQHGAVSKNVVEELATNIRVKFNTDYGISISGIAGPDGGTDDKPVGTVWIAVANTSRVVALKHQFGNDRKANKERACSTALLMLLKMLSE